MQFHILIWMLPNTLLSVWMMVSMRWVDSVCYRVHALNNILNTQYSTLHTQREALWKSDILKCLLIVEHIQSRVLRLYVCLCLSVCLLRFVVVKLILMKSIYAETCNSILQSNMITFVLVNVFASYWMRSDVIMLLPLHVRLVFKFVDL